MNLINQIYVDKDGEFILTTFPMTNVETGELMVGYFYPKNKSAVYVMNVSKFYADYQWHDPYQDV